MVSQLDKVKILVIEDDPVMHDIIKLYFKEKPDYHIVGHVDNYDSAIKSIQILEPNIILIDITLKGDKNGIEIAKWINNNQIDVPFVYVTSHINNDILNEAKETKPAGYLTKPFSLQTIHSTIQIALYNYQSQISDEVIDIVDGKKKYRVKLSEIIYISSEHVYLNIVTLTKTIVIRSSIPKLLGNLTQDCFVQINRSTIINKDYIQEKDKTNVVLNGKKFFVSKLYFPDNLDL